jgi:dipeptidyl aminopeptidase/acylaminoacyl peptidase
MHRLTPARIARRHRVILVCAVGLVAACTGVPPAEQTPVPSVAPVASPSTRPSATASAAPITATASAAPITAAASPTPSAGPWIVFQWRAPSGGDGLFLVKPDGTGLHQLVPDLPGEEIHPDWSPDGTRLAFVNRAPGDDASSLWIVNVDGSGPRKVASCDLPCNSWDYPDWPDADPDGILLKQDADPRPDGPPKTFQIARVDVASGTITTLLTRSDGTTIEQPRLSPDGSRVAYIITKDVMTDGSDSAVFVMPAKGGKETRLTDWSLRAAHPDWLDPDTIVFNSDDLFLYNLGVGRLSNLYAVGLADKKTRALTDFTAIGTGVTQPRVTPDGRLLVVKISDRGSNRLISWIAADGTGLQPLADGSLVGTHPQLQPTAAGG